MILSYGGRNCWSFKDWLEIDFTINGNVPAEYGFSDVRVVPALCFQGANASGKTCAIRVLSFIYEFCKNSFSYEPEAPIPFDSFFNSTDETEMFLEFTIPDSVSPAYTYEVKLTREKVISETLSVKKGDKGRKDVVLRREGNVITKDTMFGSSKDIILRPNASFFSTFFQYGLENAKPFSKFFNAFGSNVKYRGIMNQKAKDEAAYYAEHPQVFDYVKHMLTMFDTGVKDIQLEKYMDDKGGVQYRSVFVHETEDGDKKLPLSAQSVGTVKLYSMLGDLIVALIQGVVLCVDELDTNLHTGLLQFLFLPFLSSSNSSHAQLIFTCHDYDLLDEMMKYRTYLFEKEKGESYCYRLDEINGAALRNDRSLSQQYKSGALGGVPRVKEE